MKANVIKSINYIYKAPYTACQASCYTLQGRPHSAAALASQLNRNIIFPNEGRRARASEVK